MGNRAAKTNKSGAMDRLRPLSPDERLDMTVLTNGGIPPAQARAIAQSYDHVRKRGPKNAGPLALAQKLGKLRLKQSRKTAVLSSEAHVDAPLGADGKKKVKVVKGPTFSEDKRPPQNESNGKTPSAKAPAQKSHWAPTAEAETDVGLSARDLAYIKAAYGLQAPTEAPVPDSQDVGPGLEGLMQANRLVAGMDAELEAGAGSKEAARRRASRALLERPGFYDGVGATPDVRPMRGLMLDLGSGPNRAPGHLGVDLYAFDHGTVLHDLDMGIPFPDGSARAVRLVDALHDILDAPGGKTSPVPLLNEIQRVLMEGGRLYYEGPEPLFEPGRNWPFLGLVMRHTSEPTQAGAGWQQTLERVPIRVPAYHGADPAFAPAGELPLATQMRLARDNASQADTAMANLVNKSGKRPFARFEARMPERAARALQKRPVTPVFKSVAPPSGYKQIVYGAVLVPFDIDTQGEWMTPEDIEESAHQFMATSRVIGSEHGMPIEATPVESYIAPTDMEFDTSDGPETVKKGTWVMGVKIHSSDEWQKVLKGDYSGFSVGGFGYRPDL